MSSERTGAVSAGGSLARWITLAAIVVGCCLRLGGLDVHSLWFDEGDTLAIALSGDPIGMLRDSHYPPLTLIAYREWAQAFGDATATLRLLPALLSCVALVLFAWLARRWQSPPIAAVSVALYAVSAFHVWHGQELRAYPFLELGGVMGLCGTELALRGRTWTGVVLVATGQALALGSHYMGILLAPTVSGIALIEWRTRRVDLRRATRPVAAAALGCAVWLPWIVTVMPGQIHAPGGYVARSGWRDLVELPMRLVLIELSTIPAAWRGALALLVVVLLAAFYGAGLAALVRRESSALIVLIAFAAPVASALGLTLVGPPSFQPKYLMVAAPAAALMMGAGLCLVPWTFTRRALCFAAVIGCLVFTLAQKQQNFREDYRSACTELIQSWRPGDHWTVVSGTNPKMEAGAVRHYLRARPDILEASLSIDDVTQRLSMGEVPATRLHVIYREAPYAERRLAALGDFMRLESRGESRFRIDHSVWTERRR